MRRPNPHPSPRLTAIARCCRCASHSHRLCGTRRAVLPANAFRTARSYKPTNVAQSGISVRHSRHKAYGPHWLGTARHCASGEFVQLATDLAPLFERCGAGIAVAPAQASCGLFVKAATGEYVWRLRAGRVGRVGVRSRYRQPGGCGTILRFARNRNVAETSDILC